MHTARIFAVYIVLAGCGPTTVNVTTTGEGDGEESSGPIPDASTSLGATSALGSESSDSTSHEPVDTSAGRGDASSGTTGGSSTTGGDEPPVCVVVMVGEGLACECDGALSDPSECGCPEPGAQDCVCAGALCGPCDAVGALCVCGDFIAPPERCADGGCTFDPTTATCTCDGAPSDPSLCDCIPVAGIPTECACDGFPAPAEFCD